VSVKTRGVALSSAGIIGPIWFTTLVIIQGLVMLILFIVLGRLPLTTARPSIRGRGC
jgi:hypothetical protein